MSTHPTWWWPTRKKQISLLAMGHIFSGMWLSQHLVFLTSVTARAVVFGQGRRDMYKLGHLACWQGTRRRFGGWGEGSSSPPQHVKLNTFFFTMCLTVSLTIILGCGTKIPITLSRTEWRLNVGQCFGGRETLYSYAVQCTKLQYESSTQDHVYLLSFCPGHMTSVYPCWKWNLADMTFPL